MGIAAGWGDGVCISPGPKFCWRHRSKNILSGRKFSEYIPKFLYLQMFPNKVTEGKIRGEIRICGGWFWSRLRSRRILSGSGSDSDSGLKISTPTPTPTPLRLRLSRMYSILKTAKYGAAILLISLLIVFKRMIRQHISQLRKQAVLIPLNLVRVSVFECNDTVTNRSQWS